MATDRELRESRLVFYRDDLARIDRVLEEFARLANAASVLLIDKEGHLITRCGEPPSFDLDTISALVAGSFQATREMARLLGEEQFSALFHQGARENIQLSLVGDRTILTVIFDDTTTLGMVRVCVADAVRKLASLFEQIGRRRDAPIEAELAGLADLETSAKDTLDALFDGN